MKGDFLLLKNVSDIIIVLVLSLMYSVLKISLLISRYIAIKASLFCLWL